MFNTRVSVTALVVTAFALFGGVVAQAANGTWNSTGAGSNAFWTNSLNWSASPYPSGTDTATLNNSGNGQTVIDVTGLVSVANITFDTASAAAYTLGTGAANSQPLVMGDGGVFRMNSTVATGQTINAAIQLGPNTTSASYSFRNDTAGQTLTLNKIAGTTGGTKTVTFDGSGPISVLGNLDRSGSTLNVTVNSTGTLTLAGSSNPLTLLQINGSNSVINLAAGTTTSINDGGGSGIMSAQNCTINGPGVLSLSTAGGENYADNGAAAGTTLTINAKLTGATGFEFWHSTYTGTIVLAGTNDFTQNVIMNVLGTISCSVINNKGVAGNLGAGTSFIYGTGVNARLLYTGTGETTDRILDIRNNGILEMAGTGNLKFTTPVTVTSGAKTLTLQGSTAGTGEFGGALRNDSGTLGLTKAGTGTWTLSTTNTYTGATAVNGGTLALTGANGAITASAGITLANGATLALINAVGTNNADRIGNAVPVTLNGGTLSISSSGGAVNTSETIGSLVIGLNSNTVAVAQAASGQTSTLQLSAFSRAGAGTVDFSGTGIGESDRNRIFITGQADGPLGPWATVNGTSYAAYSSTLGIYATTAAATNIAARGPSSVIPDDATAAVHITTAGTSGPITLAGATVDSAFSLQQDTATDATVSTLGKTLKTLQLQVSSGQANLTVGEAQGDGAVSALTPAGNLTLGNDDATSVLTVNAAITNNTSASSVSKTGVGKVLLTGPLGYTGTTGLGGGTLAFGGSLTQTLASVISGSGALSKEGSGKLTLSGANTYTGLTVISSGILLAQNSAALGTADSGTVITNGGTLDLGGTLGAQALNLNAEQITVSGAGVNGRGAIINSSNTSQYNALRLVTLAGNTTFGGEQSGARWDIRNASGNAIFSMNGFTVTKVGTNQVGLTNVAVTNGAGNIDIKEGNFTMEVATTLGGSSNNLMSVRGGATFDTYQLSTPVVWSLSMDDNSRFYARSGNATNQNIWSGPVALNGRAVFDGANPSIEVLSGNISGTGSVVKIGTGSVTYFTSSNNTYSGTTTISNGLLYAKYPGSLPGYASGKLAVLSGGAVTLPTGDGVTGWSIAQIKSLLDTSSFTAPDAVLGLETSANLDYPYPFPAVLGLTKQGSGVLNVSDNQSIVSQIKVNGGELVLDNMTINATNVASTVGDAATDYGKLTLSNAVWYSILPASGIFCPLLSIGNSGKGVLVVQGNTALTNRLMLGSNAGALGAVYQQNGNIVNWGGTGYDGRIGLYGYGYYELNGGFLLHKGWTQIGYGLSGVGIFKVSGGTFTQTSDFGGDLGLSRGGTGVVYVTAGTFNALQELWVGDANDNSATKGFADFTVAGGKATITGSVKMADRTNMTAVVNLNGGVLEASQIYRAVRSGSSATVGFNGGTFRARTSGALFGTGTAAPDSVSIYAGGAIFDTTNYDVSVSVPLLAPTGSGISSIPITASTGFMGPPFVTLSGGGGTGATAIAQFNSANGTVSGVLVTCPGFGYTTNPVATFSGGGTNFIPAVSNAIVRTANVSGGLTKLGSASLTLYATNTYAGATTVSNGILRLGVAKALPTGTDVNVMGGTLDMGGFNLTNGNVKTSGGSIINGSLTSGSFNKSGNGTLSLSAQLSSSNPLVIGGGTLRMQPASPGLYEGVYSNNFDTVDPNPNTSVRLTTRAANGSWGTSGASGGIWADNETYIYSGYLWNRATTNANWTFAENFDDSVLLKIDGNTVLNNGTWNVPTIGTYNLTPGAHAFELRLGQGSGGVGAPTSIYAWWNTYAFGFGYDPLGRNDTNILNYSVMTDPGDGSLFTLSTTGAGATNMINSASSIELAAGSSLDLSGFYQSFANLSGSGTVSNGTLAVTGTIAPGGTNVIGTLTVAASTMLTGTLLIDVATDGTSDRLAIQGNVNLSALNLVIANPAQLDRSKLYTILTCTGTRTGRFSSITVPNRHWLARYQSDGTVKLLFVDPTLLQLL